MGLLIHWVLRSSHKQVYTNGRVRGRLIGGFFVLSTSSTRSPADGQQFNRHSTWHDGDPRVRVPNPEQRRAKIDGDLRPGFRDFPEIPEIVIFGSFFPTQCHSSPHPLQKNGGYSVLSLCAIYYHSDDGVWNCKCHVEHDQRSVQVQG